MAFSKKTVLALAPTVPTGGASPPPATVGFADKDFTPSVVYVLVAFAILATGLVVSVLVFPDDAFKTRVIGAPVSGLTIFAVFFVGAQGIERLLEPVAMLFPSETKAELKEAVDEAQKKVNESAANPADNAAKSGAESAVATAAEKKATKEIDYGNRKVVFWAAASLLGFIASAGLKLYLLRTVGIADPPRWAEVLATGLIIGSGTKPLHDLVELISAKKEAAQSSTGSAK